MNQPLDQLTGGSCVIGTQGRAQIGQRCARCIGDDKFAVVHLNHKFVGSAGERDKAAAMRTNCRLHLAAQPGISDFDAHITLQFDIRRIEHDRLCANINGRRLPLSDLRPAIDFVHLGNRNQGETCLRIVKISGADWIDRELGALADAMHGTRP